MTGQATADRFLRDVRANRFNRAILERWESLALPDGWLVAGCLFQTVWNLRSGAAESADQPRGAVRGEGEVIPGAVAVAPGRMRRWRPRTSQPTASFQPGVTVFTKSLQQ